MDYFSFTAVNIDLSKGHEPGKYRGPRRQVRLCFKMMPVDQSTKVVLGWRLKVVNIASYIPKLYDHKHMRSGDYCSKMILHVGTQCQ